MKDTDRIISVGIIKYIKSKFPNKIISPKGISSTLMTVCGAGFLNPSSIKIYEEMK